MKNKFVIVFFIVLGVAGKAQSDSIAYKIIYSPKMPVLKIEQTMTLYREIPDAFFHFYAWANAYKDQTTSLNKLQLNQRKDDLHFAPMEERGWVENVHFKLIGDNGELFPLAYIKPENELIKVVVPKFKKLKIKATYDVHLPNSKFTGYGKSDDESLLLKYFFLQPEVREKGVLLKQKFKDLEYLTAKKTNYYLNLQVPNDFEVYTDLKRINLYDYEGINRDFFQISIKKKGRNKIVYTPYGTVIIDHKFSEEDEEILHGVVSEQLKYLSDKLGGLNEPLYISSKKFNQNKFQGVQDVNIPVIHKKYKLFEPKDRLRLEMISQLSNAFVDRKILVNMQKYHWVRHGLAHYLLVKYIENTLPELKAVGEVPDDLAVGNFKPLNFFEISKIKMSERSKWLYLISLKNNLDQAINTPYDKLSVVNRQLVSGVKAGLAFDYLAKYIGEGEFDFMLKNWIDLNKEIDFKSYFIQYSSKEINWFFQGMINADNWGDFGIEQVDVLQNSVKVKIRKRGGANLPIQIKGYAKTNVETRWEKISGDSFVTFFPKKNYTKFTLNDSILLPDFNLENDLYRMSGFFRRKVKLSLLADVPSEKFTQLFMMPDASWNNYDKLQIGLSVTNKTLLPQEWVYGISPQYSTGEGSLTGGFNINRNIYPNNSWFRHLRISMGGAYRHYGKGLAYKNLGLGLYGNFKKKARSTENRKIHLNYQQIERQLPVNVEPEHAEINDYGLLNLGYNYWNTNLIHERKLQLNFQASNSFSKFFVEYYYRWQFNKDKKLGVRVFGGAFLKHTLKHSTYFDFGVDRVSDYTFSFPLLGRSEKDGLLSQQFVLSEGGFKSNFHRKSNYLLLTTNIEYPIWKILDGYLDVGYTQNKEENADFIYDSGFRIRFIPDFIELYFPIQSTLGFEPTLGAYHKRIRFMLNLDLQKFIAYWNRNKT